MSYGTRTSDRWKSEPGQMDALNLKHVFPTDSPYGIPSLKPADFVPTELVTWHDRRGRAAAVKRREESPKHKPCLHFFVDDYRFETVWRFPERLGRMYDIGAALTPDFSIWLDTPTAAGIWQTYRSRWCGAYWQACGITVIPTAMWSTPESYLWCFDGLPKHSTIAISSVGVHRDREARALFQDGLDELVHRTQPSHLLIYGPLPKDCQVDVPVVEYPSGWADRRAAH